MVGNSGWFRTYYKMLDWEWKRKPEMVALFVHLLLSANWEDKQWKGITIKKGSFVTSIQKLSEEVGISIRTNRTCLKRLKTTNEITIKTTNNYTLVTINNYDKYQSPTNKTTNERQTKTEKTTTTKEYNIRSKEEYIAKPNTIIQQIVGLYVLAQKLNFENNEQKKVFWSRNVRPAQGLSSYSLPDIALTMVIIDTDPKRDYPWTLETVSKRIDKVRSNIEKVPFELKKKAEQLLVQGGENGKS